MVCGIDRAKFRSINQLSYQLYIISLNQIAEGEKCNMTKEGLLEKYHESTALLIYRGPYTASEFFAFAIAKKAFTDVFRRSPKIFNAKDVFKPEGLPVLDDCTEHDDSYLILPYKNGQVFTEDGIVEGTCPVLDAWEQFGHIIEPDADVFDMVCDTMRRNVSNTTMGSLYGIDFLLQTYNPSWEEVNELLNSSGYKEMFSLQKKCTVNGISAASSLLNRLIIQSRSNVRLGKAIDSAFEESVKDSRLVLSDGNAIIIFNEKYRLYNPITTICRYCRYWGNIAFVIQPNRLDSDVIGYCANITYGVFGEPALEFAPFLSDERWGSLRLLSDGITIKCGRDDIDILINFCRYVYDMYTASNTIDSDESCQESALPEVEKKNRG